MRTILMASAAATLLLIAPAGAQQDTKSKTTQPSASTTAPGSTAQQGAKSSTGQTGGAVKEAVQQKGPNRADFYTVRPADMAASDIIGMDVRNTMNEDLGEIEDVIIDDGKTIRAIVLDIGGFLGAGDRHVAVTPGSVLIVKEQDGSQHAVVNATKDTLTNAPQFKAPTQQQRRG